MGNANKGALLPSVKADIETKLNCPDAAADKLHEIPAERLDEVAALSFVETRQRILQKQWTLPDVVKALHRRKQVQNNELYALTDVFYTQPLQHATALQAAVDADAAAAAELYPLLGCVLSIKDSVVYKGSSCTHGFRKGYNQPYDTTAPLIGHLERLGAVVVCKGNVSQALMSSESSNMVFGSTSHPLPDHRGRSAGGSSGGDAANVASRVVHCAIGSDIAGSLRFPALYCGLYTLKASAGRLSDCTGTSFAEKWPEHGTTGDRQMLIASTCGPLARTAADLHLLLQHMVAFNAESLEVPPLPWRLPRPPGEGKKPLRVGVMAPYALLEPSPAQARALLEAAGTPGLETVGIDINDLLPDLVTGALACYMRDEETMKLCRGKLPLGEPVIDNYDAFATLAAAPKEVLRLLQYTPAFCEREKIYIKAYLWAHDVNVAVILGHQRRLREEVIRRFRAQGVTVCLAHGPPPAPPKSGIVDCDLFCFYCFIWNYLNFAVGGAPVTTVRADEQTYVSTWDDKITRGLRDKVLAGSAGLPVGVQVVGLPWHEESVMEVLLRLEEGAPRGEVKK